MIDFKIPGEPKGKARARTFYNQKSNKITTMTPEGTVMYENWIKTCFQQAKYKGFKPLEGPISMMITARYGVPKSKSKKMKELMLNGTLYPEKKPDADNIAKVVCDALNGLAYKDDCQIVSLLVTKQYSEEPHVNVFIHQEFNG